MGGDEDRIGMGWGWGCSFSCHSIVSSTTAQKRQCVRCEIAGRPCPSGRIAMCHLLNVPTHRCADVMFKGPFIAIQLNSTQLNSTSSCRRVRSVNNCHLSMNVVTQLTQFVGHDVINKNTTDLLRTNWL